MSITKASPISPAATDVASFPSYVGGDSQSRITRIPGVFALQSLLPRTKSWPPHGNAGEFFFYLRKLT